MSKSRPVREYMIEHPYTIDYLDTLTAAEKLMQTHRIRHLPVVDGRKVMGVISDRDLMVAKNVYKNRASGAADVMVKEICDFEPCIASPDTPVEKVAHDMAHKRWDAVVVAQNEVPVGIFTANDACRLLAEVLAARRKAKGKGFWASIFGGS